jgi:hypothetical protein
LRLSGAVVSTRMNTLRLTKPKAVIGNRAKPRKATLCEQYAELLRLREEIKLLSASGVKSKKPLPTSEGDPPGKNLQD